MLSVNVEEKALCTFKGSIVSKFSDVTLSLNIVTDIVVSVVNFLRKKNEHLGWVEA